MRSANWRIRPTAGRRPEGVDRAFIVSVHPAPFLATSMSTPMRRTDTNQFIEVRAARLEGAPVGERRRWSQDFKDRAITASLEPGTNVSALARSLDIAPSHLFGWRRAAALRAEKIERQAPAEPRAAKTRRVEIELGGAGEAMVERHYGHLAPTICAPRSR
ncbi:transposase [Methylosinus sporium]|uniref:Transposase n=1 Tax=Methylosinus sporium TaxID=428 RepID=A0A549T8E3_METSR|nr:transposase [Methylosinus sporium]